MFLSGSDPNFCSWFWTGKPAKAKDSNKKRKRSRSPSVDLDAASESDAKKSKSKKKRLIIDVVDDADVHEDQDDEVDDCLGSFSILVLLCFRSRPLVFVFVNNFDCSQLPNCHLLDRGRLLPQALPNPQRRLLKSAKAKANPCSTRNAKPITRAKRRHKVTTTTKS
jgi:hypothetical protein